MKTRTESADVNAADPLAEFLLVVDQALEVLEDERVVFLTGAYAEIPQIVSRKQAVLSDLDTVVASAPRSDEVVAAMRRLIAASRRNEQLIQAARQGLSHAKRRIAKIRETGRGAVAYKEDGSRIASRADLISSGKSA